MKSHKTTKVAVLLATFNGARYVEAQIKSLSDNVTPFTLHWLDDHSTDNTREIVRSAALSAGIELQECHQPQRQGVPGTFFELIDCVDADIYLFCDQDDIWQKGKIDATVANLLPDLSKPVLCFSDPLLFYENEPEVFYRVSKINRAHVPAALKESRCLLCCPATGQSIGLTRPLREMYLRHKNIARKHAFMHSWWMYILAVAVGEVRLMSDVPTTLYRQHGSNVTTLFYAKNPNFISRIASKHRAQDTLRRSLALQSKGFILASATLPPGPKLQRLLAIASLVASLDHRQTPIALARLLLRRAMWPWWYNQFWLMAICLWSDAKPLAVGLSDQITEPSTALSNI